MDINRKSLRALGLVLLGHALVSSSPLGAALGVGEPAGAGMSLKHGLTETVGSLLSWESAGAWVG